ncbi:endonuclease domain-containing 1 protein [Amia ocellicauda]|uniref:endonuclease domain-containing 1 protein n=1 Tax=Amia ocellicauda TaxID=2972642 RepID=UPI00346495EE
MMSAISRLLASSSWSVLLQKSLHFLLNMLRFHTGAAVLALTAAWVCQADVGDFTPCERFFYNAWPPKGLVGAAICQRYLNKYHFASLYDRHRRTPSYSAYLFSPADTKRPHTHWKYEPQLAYAKADGNMIPFPPGPVDQNVVQSQAIELDYINSSYTRGHLSPSLHHSDDIDKCATFTLTNVVPQKGPSNDGPWAAFEKDIKNRLTSYCAKEAYIVTGVIPYQKDRWIKGDRVAIPEYLWSAYCCPSYNTSIPANLTQAFPTYAAIGRNDPNSTEEIVPVDKTRPKKYLGYDVRLMSLKTLEMYLQDRLGTVFSVFYNGCST